VLIRHPPQGATQSIKEPAIQAAFNVKAFWRAGTIFAERGFLATALESRKSQVRYSFIGVLPRSVARCKHAGVRSSTVPGG
jgi:hypothetical protein